jgi:hypothetical protein
MLHFFKANIDCEIFFAVLALLFLNETRIRENIESIVDCLSKPNNTGLLHKLREKLGSE